MSKSRGIKSTKETIALVIQKIVKKCKSISQFANDLEKNGFEPYYRNNKLSGIWMGNRKYRLTTLGVDKSKIRELTLEEERMKQLEKSNSRKHKNIDKEL